MRHSAGVATCHLNGLALMTGLRMGHTQSPPSCLFLFADVLEVKKAYFMLLENCIMSDKLG